ncbi:Flp pilus assembly protein CpaB [Pelolinea submarina]|uniref:Pilus assembly protein CpaB n=1 Tax=Pelolinea submarina TaxID=913107 RepID=A0A347ZRX6_9CHLR|nr:Flp pilus assembly protein CpaB [Pelolinea submarina]REG11385.1 pilus assembly protein CpaB [Pelolinea submarina]BBB48057.1 pilus assembly protein CpaB [Pelolinea submarina]
MKKILPVLLAAVAFIVVLLILSPTPEENVLVAAYDLSMGHVIEEGDVVYATFPKEMVPEDAVFEPSEIIGLALLTGRSQGDIIRASNIGSEPMALAPNERAVAITVDNASGLAGLLRPGDLVGITAVIDSSNQGEKGTYSKATIENLRVLYLSPEFQSIDPDENILTSETDNTSATVSTTRKTEGALVLAVSIESDNIVYDFKDVEPELGTQLRNVNVVEMLTALEASDGARLYVYLMPRNAEEMVTSGLWLPELVIKPYKPTPTVNPYALETPTPAPVVVGGE